MVLTNFPLAEKILQGCPMNFGESSIKRFNSAGLGNNDKSIIGSNLSASVDFVGIVIPLHTKKVAEEV